MKDLFDPTLADDTKQRIMRLHPESERRWGLSAWWTVDFSTARHRAKQSRLLYLAALDRLVRSGKIVGASVFCSGSSS
jgi:hypothetical protein